jgi:hypothetical protein
LIPLLLSLSAVLQLPVQVDPAGQVYSGREGRLGEPAWATDGPYGLPLDEKDLRQDGFFMKLSYLFRL